MLNGIVRSHKTNKFQTTSQKGRRPGVQILRNAAYLAYAAMAKDEAQRSIRPFGEAVNA